MNYRFIFSIFLCLLLAACGDTSKKTSNTANTTPQRKTVPLVQNPKTAPKPKPQKSSKSIVVAPKTTEANKGETICVDFDVLDYNNIVATQYSINWNPKDLDFTELKSFQMKDLSKNNFGTKSVKEGKISFSWYDQAVQGISIPDKTVIYQVCFKAIGESGTKAKVQITEDPIIIEIVGKGNEFLQFFSNTGYVKIK